MQGTSRVLPRDRKKRENSCFFLTIAPGNWFLMMVSLFSIHPYPAKSVCLAAFQRSTSEKNGRATSQELVVEALRPQRTRCQWCRVPRRPFSGGRKVDAGSPSRPLITERTKKGKRRETRVTVNLFISRDGRLPCRPIFFLPTRIENN